MAANLAVQNNARDGVSWVDMHKLANKVMLTELRTAGLVVGEIDDMMAAGINGIFQPHGLGHLLGLDVHDVGAFLPHCPPRSTEPGLKSLRMSRVLKAGMYMTIEVTFSVKSKLSFIILHYSHSLDVTSLITY